MDGGRRTVYLWVGEYGGWAGLDLVPKLVDALQLAGKKVVGASAGRGHTAAWTEEGELFTGGRMWGAGLRRGRLVEAGKRVVGASAGSDHLAPVERDNVVGWATGGSRTSLC